jgi:hypothetical protein
VSRCRRHGNGVAFPDWQRATGAHECVKIEVAAYKLDLGNVVPSIHVRGPSLNVDHGVWPTRRRVDGCGAAQTTFGVPDITLTCTSMPRWSDGNPIKVP